MEFIFMEFIFMEFKFILQYIYSFTIVRSLICAFFILLYAAFFYYLVFFYVLRKYDIVREIFNIKN
jgi:hypothetical protein